MCDMCEENPGEPVRCVHCGREICFDFGVVDDVSAPAVLDRKGEISCAPCARRMQTVEE